MDVLMPVMDGLEATRRIRQNETGADVPIILVSATVADEDQPAWRAAGGNAFVAKPVKREALLKQIGLLLDLTWTFRQPGAAPVVQPGPHETEFFETIPTRQELNALHHYTLMGNMSSVADEAGRIVALDERYRPFTDKVQYLARTYQSKALVALVEECLEQSPE
jgi:CheY-like chemotaxis protein